MTREICDNHYHQTIAALAEDIWTKHLISAEDHGISSRDACAILSSAAAMAEATVLGFVERDAGRLITDAPLREVVASFELTFLKTLSEVAPLTDETRRRMGSLDRRVKRARELPVEPGGEA